MLLPISAVSASDVSLQNNGPKPENQSGSSAPVPVPLPEPEASVNSASATVRAVSGQVQLSQNSTVLAETLGKLMNIARMENETAGAYATRLVTAMQALPADQKAMLEQTLGKLMKGLTVAILIDALKNSAGPDAARLAVIFELARSLPTSATPRTGRSSYLQDAMLRTPSLTPMKMALPMPTPGGGSSTATIPTTQTPSARNDQNLVRIAEEQHGRITSSPLSRALMDAVPKSTGSLERSPTQVEGNAAGKEASSVKPLPLPTFSDNDGVKVRATDGQLAQARSIASSASQIDAEANEQTPKSFSPLPQLPDLRLPPEAIKQQFSDANAKDMEKLLFAVLVGELPPDADIDQAASSTIFRSKENVQAEPKSPNGATPALIRSAMETAQSDATTQVRTEMQGAHKAAATADMKNVLFEQPALHSAVAAMITKEGIPLPFVNYPAENDEPESDTPPRGRWPSTSDGEPGPDDQSGKQQQEQPDQEERVAANDEAGDQSVSGGASEDGRVGDAESYYLRMSSFA